MSVRFAVLNVPDGRLADAISACYVHKFSSMRECLSDFANICFRQSRLWLSRRNAAHMAPCHSATDARDRRFCQAETPGYRDRLFSALQCGNDIGGLRVGQSRVSVAFSACKELRLQSRVMAVARRIRLWVCGVTIPVSTRDTLWVQARCVSFTGCGASDHRHMCRVRGRSASHDMSRVAALAVLRRSNWIVHIAQMHRNETLRHRTVHEFPRDDVRRTRLIPNADTTVTSSAHTGRERVAGVRSSTSINLGKQTLSKCGARHMSLFYYDKQQEQGRAIA